MLIGFKDSIFYLLIRCLLQIPFIGEQSLGPVTFRTWDFGGQREYYATHQYFLSRRSIYLVVWKITDGEAAVTDIHQWLVNIQVISILLKTNSNLR